MVGKKEKYSMRSFILRQCTAETHRVVFENLKDLTTVCARYNYYNSQLRTMRWHLMKK